MIDMFERFRKKEGNERFGSEMVEEKPQENFEPEPESLVSIPEPKPITENQPFEPQTTVSSTTSSNIGIDGLIDKRVRLEEAIDYVGVMIKSLKEKRTKLEKDIEEESVDIKNLKEKLVKVREYINEENKGIEDLTRKRSEVERTADEVGNVINELKNKLSGIDNVVDTEGKKIQSFKESRPK